MWLCQTSAGIRGLDFYSNVQQRAVLDDLIPLETREGGLDPVSGSWQQRDITSTMTRLE